MNYHELRKEYNSFEKIPYDRLLLTEDWKSKREEILLRDNYTCTKCFSSDSGWVKNFNIYLDFKNPTTEKSIIGNFDIDEFKKKLNIKFITVYKHKSKRKGDFFFGISDNDVLLGCISLSNFEEIKSSDLQVFVVNDSDGRINPIIDLPDRRGLKKGIFFPITSPKSILMHVHHKRYIKGKFPWEYDNEDLITLCNWCHWKLHEEEEVPIYDFTNKGKLVRLEYHVCSRCNGAGIFPEYTHIENGICFRCGGAKYDELM